REAVRVGVAIGERALDVLQRLAEPLHEASAVGERAALDHPPVVDPVEEEPGPRVRLRRFVHRPNAPDVPTIKAARSRVTQPTPRFEHAPSSNAGYQPSTGASEISGRRSASTSSVSSSSWSHARACRSNKPLADAIEVLAGTGRPSSSA